MGLFARASADFPRERYVNSFDVSSTGRDLLNRRTDHPAEKGQIRPLKVAQKDRLFPLPSGHTLEGLHLVDFTYLIRLLLTWQEERELS